MSAVGPTCGQIAPIRPVTAIRAVVVPVRISAVELRRSRPAPHERDAALSGRRSVAASKFRERERHATHLGDVAEVAGAVRERLRVRGVGGERTSAWAALRSASGKQAHRRVKMLWRAVKHQQPRPRRRRCPLQLEKGAGEGSSGVGDGARRRLHAACVGRDGVLDESSVQNDGHVLIGGEYVAQCRYRDVAHLSDTIGVPCVSRA